MSGLLGAAGPLLDLLAQWRPVYQCWSDHLARRGGDGEPPWTAADQARLDRLADLDPDGLAAAADRLRQAAAELEEIGRAVGAVGAGVGFLAERCADVVARIERRASEASVLADELQSAAGRLAVLLTAVGEQLRRAVAHLVDSVPARSPALTRLTWRELDELVSRHAAMLAGPRDALAVADRGDGWCPSAAPGWCTEPATDHMAGSVTGGVWTSEPAVPDHTLVVDLVPAEPPTPPATRTVIESGSGPVLPGTEGGQIGTDLGVEVPELPDISRVAPPAEFRHRLGESAANSGGVRDSRITGG